ncbi:MAG: hypothetical protein AAFQ84_12760 [Pseudomonadota bacterium]
MLRTFVTAAICFATVNSLTAAEDQPKGVVSRIEVQVNVLGLYGPTGSAADIGIGFVWLLEDGRAWPVGEAVFDVDKISREMASDPDDVMAWRRRGGDIELKSADDTDWKETIAEIQPYAGALPVGRYLPVPYTPSTLNESFRGRLYEVFPGGRMDIAEIPKRGPRQVTAASGTYEVDGYTLKLELAGAPAELHPLLVMGDERAADGQARYVWIAGEQYERF